MSNPTLNPLNNTGPGCSCNTASIQHGDHMARTRKWVNIVGVSCIYNQTADCVCPPLLRANYK